MLDVPTSLDALSRRCPRLGGEVTFGYCRKEAGDLPCGRSLICWGDVFPVQQYMERILSEAEWKTAFEKPCSNRLDAILKAAEPTKDRS